MLDLIIHYAYPLMIPLSLVEGPIVAFAAGVGTAAGRINPFIAYAIVMGGGLFQDVVYYGLGLKAQTSPKVRRWVARLRLLRDTLGPLEQAWRDRMFATLIGSKFAYGLYAPIIVTAGMAKAPFWRFLGESLAISAVVLGAWLAAGLGAGRLYGAIEGRYATWAMIGLGVVALAGLFFIARHVRSRLAPARNGGQRDASS